MAALFGVTGGIWFIYLTTFYIIYYSGLFKPYSLLLLGNEMLEQFLFFVDPIVYIAMSSELRKTLLRIVRAPMPNTLSMTGSAAQTRASGRLGGSTVGASRTTARAIPRSRRVFPENDRRDNLPHAVVGKENGDGDGVDGVGG